MSYKKQKLLVTGVSGFLGWNLAKIAKEKWQVSGLYHSRSIAIDRVQTFSCDLENSQALTKLFEKFRPHAVIHLAAQSSPNFCERYPEISRRINVEASETLASLCEQNKIPLVFTSSSQVYGGDDASYTEQSRTNPLNAYGQEKLEAEHRILAAYPAATICRLPLMFGAAPPGATSSLQAVLHSLRNKQSIKLFTDEIRSSLGARSASNGLLKSIDHPGELFILAGDESLSRYEFGRRVAKYLKLNDSPLTPANQADLKMAAVRPADLTMDNSKAKSICFFPQTIEEELEYALKLGA